MPNLIALRRAEALVKREIKEAKRESFKTFVSGINSYTPVAKVWRQIGKLSNKQAAFRATPLLQHQCFITDPTHKANIIAEHYACLLGAAGASDARLAGEPYILPVAVAVSEDHTVAYNDLFSLHELQQAVKMLNMSAPGHDMVHNAMLRHLPADYEEWLLKILNYSYEHGELPSSWKQAIILPILKPGKPTSYPASYRPISLLPCIPKLLERLISSRLKYF